MHILHVEDDAATGEAVQLMLCGDGHSAAHVATVADALQCIRAYTYDLVICDIDLPDATGISLVRMLRLEKNPVPVLMLSGRDSVEDKVRALDCGADDYMTKPCRREELLARVKAIVRRSSGYASQTIEAGPIQVDLGAQNVRVAGAAVRLTHKEYRIVELLALRRGRTLTKEMFLNHLYGGLDEPDVKIIDVFICKLRKKLVAALGHDPIETIWGRGYMLRDPQVENRA